MTTRPLCSPRPLCRALQARLPSIWACVLSTLLCAAAQQVLAQPSQDKADQQPLPNGLVDRGIRPGELDVKSGSAKGMRIGEVSHMLLGGFDQEVLRKDGKFVLYFRLSGTNKIVAGYIRYVHLLPAKTKEV